MAANVKEATIKPADPNLDLTAFRSFIASVPPFVHHNLIAGNKKYTTGVVLIIIGGVAYGCYKFYQSCRTSGGGPPGLFGDFSDHTISTPGSQTDNPSTSTPRTSEQPSFIRGFVQKWWVPIFDQDLNLDTVREAETLQHDARHHSQEHDRTKNTKLWHYSEFDDYTTNFLDLTPSSQNADLSLSIDEHAAQFQVPPELIHLMHATRILGQYDKESMLTVWRSVRTVSLAQGQILFKPGDPDDHLYVLTSGLMEVVIAEHDMGRIKLKHIQPGGQIYSILSFIDVITGNSTPIRTIEVKALEPCTLVKVPINAFRENWMEQPALLIQSVRRLIRRIYQVVFVALHKVLGLTSELIRDMDRPPLDPAFLADTSDIPSQQDKDAAVIGLRIYLDSTDTEFDVYFKTCEIYVIGAGTEIATAGTRNSNFVYVHRGELEVSQMAEFLEREGKKKDEVMFFVTEGNVVGGLSYLTDDVNLFNVRVPEKAVICVMPGEEMEAITFTLWGLYTVHPQVILKIAHSIVGRLSPFTRQMDFGIEWTHVESGAAPIYKVGDSSEYTYLVLSGRLRSILHNKGKRIVIGEYGRNDWVGLVETLTQKKRTKTVLPVRDTELAKIPDGVLNLIKMKFPIATIRLLDFVGNRVSTSYKLGTQEDLVNQEHVTVIQSASHGCSTIALLQSTKSVPTLAVAFEIKRAYLAMTSNFFAQIVTHENAQEEFGPNAVDPSNDYLLTSWLANLELDMGLVIFVADPKPTMWTLKCIKQADIILILANAKESDTISPIEKLAITHAPRSKKELLLFHNANMLISDNGGNVNENVPSLGIPRRTRRWLEHRHWLSMHHHIKLYKYHFVLMGTSYDTVWKYYRENYVYDIHSDFARLTRWISGCSTGIVLGGGGAKGAAHIGLLRAILDRKIPIDLVCGVSIGSFIGALYAVHQSVDKVDKYMEGWFERMTRLYEYIMDMTLPIVSLFKGEAFNNSLKQLFAEIQIEDLWLPYFCVSTDLTGAGPRIHRCGSVWRYTRASMGLVAYFPPMCDPLDGHYLLDGGYTNLVPANIMRDFGAKYIIAIDVSSEEDKSCTNYGDQISGFRVLMHMIFPFLKTLKIPNLFKLQTQLAFVQSALYLDMVRKMDNATVYIRPPIDEFSTSEFSKYLPMRETGLKFGKAVLCKCDSNESLATQWLQMNPNTKLLQDDTLVNQLKEIEASTAATARRITAEIGDLDDRRPSTVSFFQQLRTRRTSSMVN